MKFNLKALAAAVGLAVVAGQASAAIRSPSDANGSELFAVIYDTEAGSSKASFTLDLGITLDAFLPSPAGTGATALGNKLPFNLTANSNWQSFLEATDGTPQLSFVVLAGDTSGGTAAGGQRYMATGASNPFAGKTNSNISTNLTTAFSAYVSYVNARGTNPTEANGSVVLTDSANGANNFGRSGTMTQTWNGQLANMSGALGSSLNFYMAQRNAASNGNTAAAAVDQFDNINGAAKWTFNQASNGDYMLTYTAPVPEPETWALMLAGALLVGRVARRRSVK